MLKSENEKWSTYAKKMNYYKLLDGKKKVMDKKQILSWEDGIKDSYPDWEDMSTDKRHDVLADAPMVSFDKLNPPPKQKIPDKKKSLYDIGNMTDENFVKYICDYIKSKGDPIKVSYRDEDCIKMVKEEKKHYPTEKHSVSRCSIMNEIDNIEESFVIDSTNLKEQLIDFVLPRLIIYRLERGATKPLPDYLQDINLVSPLSEMALKTLKN